MPRFFFHVDDGTFYPDRGGTDLLDLATAQAEAVKACGSILEDFDGEFWTSGKSWIMSVTDHEGLLLFELRFSARLPSGRVIFQPLDD